MTAILSATTLSLIVVLAQVTVVSGMMQSSELAPLIGAGMLSVIPRFTRIGAFVRDLGEEAGRIFTEVLLSCDRVGLIGRQMFAIDGVKLPSNADKRRSAAHADLRREARRMERAVQKMLQAHRARDEAKDSDAERAVERVRIDKMRAEAKRIREFLAAHEERRSEKGAVRKSNVTDNDSAKKANAKAVIQGYAAIAAVDSKAPIIVAAQPHGSGSEQDALVPMIDTTSPLRSDQTIITAVAGYHSEANLRGLYERNVRSVHDRPGGPHLNTDTTKPGRKAQIEALLPELPGVSARRINGLDAYFVNDKMFACISGNGVGLRLPAATAIELEFSRGNVVPFQPGGMASSREWIQINRDDAAKYEKDFELFRASLEFVRAARIR